MSTRPYLLMLIILLFALAPACVHAAGELSGSVLYGVGQYRAEVDGKEVQEVKSQYEQFKLQYRTQGLIGDERFGKYTLLLGYEFNILDPTLVENGIRDQDAERIEVDKLLYQGEFIVAPGGLPFRIHAYARDIHRSAYLPGLYQLNLPIGLQDKRAGQFGSTLLTPDIMTDINNGTHREMGVTLLLGIRNGSYLGNYRDVLSQLPRLLVDYKQIDVRDLASDNYQQHYRARDLAFISLNKKDNWVHVRHHDYVDFLDETQNYKTSQIMIGTVDQTLTRQWINYTNWIKVSADLSLTVESLREQQDTEKTYLANLFAVAQRQEFKASAFPTFERAVKGARLSHDLDLPLYFQFEPNRESKYRGGLRGTFSRDAYMEGTMAAANQFEREQRNIYLDLNSELFRKSAVVFKPRLGIVLRDNGEERGSNEKLTLELANNQQKNSVSWTAGYSLSSAQTANDSTSATSTFLEQSLYGHAEKNLSKNVRVGLRASTHHGSGTAVNNLGLERDRLQLDASSRHIEIKDVNRYLWYDYRLFIEHAGAQMNNRLEFIARTVKSDAGDLQSHEVQHMLKTTRLTNQEFALTSYFIRGTDVSVQSGETGYLEELKSKDGADVSWSSKAEYLYVPDRRIRFTLTGRAAGASEDEGGGCCGAAPSGWNTSSSRRKV